MLTQLKSISDDVYIVPTAGLPGRMHVKLGIWRCGDIPDGVSFDVGEGGWVIPFAALEEMYQLASQYRSDNEEAT